MAEITLPSGLRGEIRGLKGKEAKLLTDQSAVKRGTYVDQLLDACWLKTLDPGPYRLKDEKPNWAEVLSGDRFVALVKIRAETFGSDYDFAVACQNCSHKIAIRLDLNSDLKSKSLSPSDKEAFENGNKLTTKVKGKSVTFRLPVGLDEHRAARGSVDGEYIASLNSRIIEIEGVSDIEKFRYLEEAPLGELTGIQEAMAEHDCGIETDLKGVACDSCGEVQDKVTIPFTGAFLAPKKTKTA